MDVEFCKALVEKAERAALHERKLGKLFLTFFLTLAVGSLVAFIYAGIQEDLRIIVPYVYEVLCWVAVGSLVFSLAASCMIAIFRWQRPVYVIFKILFNREITFAIDGEHEYLGTKAYKEHVSPIIRRVEDDPCKVSKVYGLAAGIFTVALYMFFVTFYLDLINC